jgi:hypothetical protein
MKCKFCGCTENRPCLIPVDADGNLEFDRILAELGGMTIPCAWLIPEVCTAPACVEKAYLAIRLVDFGEGSAGLEIVTR